jgi:hypothetical protein
MSGRYNVCTSLAISNTSANGSSLTHPGIGEAEWAFKSTFNVHENILASSNVDLVFEGLDTYCTITLVRALLRLTGVHAPAKLNYRTVRK